MSPKIWFLFIISVFSVSSVLPASADEGMWPLYDLDKLNFENLKSRGLELSPSQITNSEGTGVADAVIRVTGGTGSFVSPQGLIITNHHIAFSSIQKQSTMKINYVKDGFYAASPEEEIPAIGFRAYVDLGSQDVTDRVLANVTDEMGYLERYESIETTIKGIVKQAEAGRDVKCRVAAIFGGKQYILHTDFMIKDVRIVYAPPEAIGNYGDEIDNWMWPRHVGDFSFLRAYVGPDGSSAEYSEDNVPYRPRSFLSMSATGIDEDDLTILIGYPGKTNRYASSFYIDHLFEFYFPRHIKVMEDVYSLLEQVGKIDPEVGLRMSSQKANISNFLKKEHGLMAGYRRLDMLTRKKDVEAGLISFMTSHPPLSNKYGSVLASIDSLYQEDVKTRDKDFVISRLLWGCDLLNLAVDLHKWSIEREKPDLERERGYQDRDVERELESLKNIQINLVPEVDKLILKMMIELALDLPPGQKILAIERIFVNTDGKQESEILDQFLDHLYGQTRMIDTEDRLRMFQLSREEYEKQEDPFVQFAISLRPELDERELRKREFEGAESRLEPMLIQAFAEWKPGQLYPDANGTKRINFGRISGYSPRDAVVYHYLTGLSGVMEKETDEYPFIVPGELKQAFLARDYGKYIDPDLADVPVDFLSTNDGTNGNSGSPLLNGRGEIIGLDFDGNLESVSDDYMYNGEISRSINSDTRYILFILDKVYHLDELLKELTIH